MAFDETYNEPESTEVLVKSLDPEHPAQLHYAHAGDAGADRITFVCPHTLARIGRYAPQPLAVLEESAVLAIARMQADGWHYIRS